jgi:hypothetical protein
MEVRRHDPTNRVARRHLRALIRTVLVTVAVFCAVCLAEERAEAQTIILTLGSSNITFPDASPGASLSISATENPISVSVTVIPSGTSWTLTVLANGDLVSGADTIPISNVTWTATGSQFVNGTLSKTTSQSVAIGPNNRTGTLSFFLANSWSYPTGSYTQTITFTAATF